MSNRRQELYDRIRGSSKNAVILEEMIRLGFWPKAGTLPQDPAEDIRREGQLMGQLQRLRAQNSRLNNLAHLRREAFKKRLAESRARQHENKLRRERERQARAEAWRAFKAQHIVYLGPGVSGGLQDHQADTERLDAQGLPHLIDARSMADAMGINVSALRFLAFARPVSQVSHYVRFEIPKKRGGTRVISAPMPRLKSVQHWLLRNVLDKVPVHQAAHGFVPERSIVSNATPHVGAKIVVNLDLQDFFPTITYKRVRGVFEKLGYSPASSTIMALLCTQPDTVEVDLDGQSYHVARSARRLPQGAPTSPALTNILCRKLDRRLHGLAASMGFVYTRYADDMTFSCAQKDANVGRLLRAVRFIVSEEGLVIHPDKTRVLRDGMQKEVTGVVVNEKLNVSRKELKRFRALLFQIERDGIEGKSWGNGSNLLSSIEGWANFVHMVNPERGAPLKARVEGILRTHNYVRPTHTPSTPKAPAPPEAAPAKKDDKWWKMW